jgi:hypothetical protein
MADAEDLRDAVSSRSFGAHIDPEAQAVVTDFLDYTEYLPSDLSRSYTLIRTLDETYERHVATVHRLTTLYGKLPQQTSTGQARKVTEDDAQSLRRHISAALDQALGARRAAREEARRINQVVKRHEARLKTIKAKLLALPKPPSRDPTPPPTLLRILSPIKGRKEGKAEKKRKKEKFVIPVVLPVQNGYDSDDEEADAKKKSPNRRRHTMDVDLLKKSPKLPKTPTIPKTAKPLKQRSPGRMGTNVHSQVAGISTTNALALLTPPPVDAQAGSMWRPWFKLTEFEMAKLRKSMKKNAVWTPSDAMVRRELQRDGRGHEFYDQAKADAAASGEALLDEESIDLLKGFNPGDVARRLLLAKEAADRKEALAAEAMYVDAASDAAEAAVGNEQKYPEKLEKSGKKSARTRAQAPNIDDVNTKLAAMGQQMKNLFDPPKPSTPLTRSNRKRKRASDKEPTDSVTGSQATSPKHPPKRVKTGDKAAQTPAKSEIGETPASTMVRTVTTIVPLAPEGPSSPLSPVNFVIPSSDKKRASSPIPTAATTRPRRGSAANLKIEELLATPSVEAYHAHNTRRRINTSTPYMPTIAKSKAASAEPPARRRELRGRKDMRRLSVNADTAPSTPTVNAANGRAGRSGRRPPGLVIAQDKDSSRGKVSLGRRKAQPTGKGAKSGGQKNEEEEDTDEERYCVCGGVSWGTMVACDNPDVSCISYSPTTVDGHADYTSARKSGSISAVWVSKRHPTARQSGIVQTAKKTAYRRIEICERESSTFASSLHDVVSSSLSLSMAVYLQT